MWLSLQYDEIFHPAKQNSMNICAYWLQKVFTLKYYSFTPLPGKKFLPKFCISWFKYACLSKCEQ